MSQSDKMYKLKPFVNLPDSMVLSQSMYTMKGFHTMPNNVAATYYTNGNPEHIMNDNSTSYDSNRASTKTEMESTLGTKQISTKSTEPCKGISDLEVRQKNILEKLKQFKLKLDSLMGNQIICLATKESTESRNHLNCMSGEGVGNWQDSVLKQLTCLKKELGTIAVEDDSGHMLCHENDIQLRQKNILQIIDALQLLLKTEISSLHTDKEKSSESSIQNYHQEVLMLIKSLRNELEKITKKFEPPKLELEAPQCHCINQPLLAKLEKNGVIHDVVISSNESQPPYFLIPLKKFFQQAGLHVYSSSSLHSSVQQVDLKVLALFQDDDNKERSRNDLGFTVLWKDQPYKSLMVNPLHQCLIKGEANILRYISRLFPAVSPFNYESRGSFSQVSETDYWLDVIECKLLEGSNKERQSLMKQLNARLGSTKWLDGEVCSLVDVFAWSVILQLNLSKDLPSKVAAWFKQMGEISGFKEGKAE